MGGTSGLGVIDGLGGWIDDLSVGHDGEQKTVGCGRGRAMDAGTTFQIGDRFRVTDQTTVFRNDVFTMTKIDRDAGLPNL